MYLSPIDDAINNIKTTLETAAVLKDKTLDNEQSQLLDLINLTQLSALNSAFKAKTLLNDLQQELEQLQQAQQNHNQWEQQKHRYALTTVPNTIAMVYGLKAGYSGDEPPHWICPNCFKNSQRSLLQPVKTRNTLWLLLCPACQTEIHLSPDYPQSPEYLK